VHGSAFPVDKFEVALDQLGHFHLVERNEEKLLRGGKARLMIRCHHRPF
jgi:hypothetical protein